MNGTNKCVFCGDFYPSACCRSCGAASRVKKFSRLLGRFALASTSTHYHDEIVALARSSQQVN